MANLDGYTPTMSTALSISATRDHGLPQLTGDFRTHNDDSYLKTSGIVTGTFISGLDQAGIGNKVAGYAYFNLDSSRQIRVPESGKIQVPNVNQLYCVYLAPYMFRPISGSNGYKLNNIQFRLPVIAGQPLGKSSDMVKV